jgi:hypothetical protein
MPTGPNGGSEELVRPVQLLAALLSLESFQPIQPL